MGAGAGHMRHPFDLAQVTSGQSFLTLMDRIKNYLESGSQTSAVKIDGINVSFKLVGDEFAVDRGSMKEIDVSGITIDRINERFPEGHGMRDAIKNLLTIFNEALPSISTEISALGLKNNPHFFLNTEYVKGAINATGYTQDFISIHGVNSFYEKYKRIPKRLGGGTQLARPGLPRPTYADPQTGEEKQDPAPSVEMPYNRQAMQNLIQKVKPIAMKYGFNLYGPVPAKMKSGVSIDYSTALSEPFSVNVSENYTELDALQGRPLRDWIMSITEKPGKYTGKGYSKSYRLLDGKSINPFHKQTYVKIISKAVPLDSFMPPESIRPVVEGAVLMHATRTMGNAILRSMTSEAMGDLMGADADNEGIVIRNQKFSPHPFKITGEFIVGGMTGNIAQLMGNLQETYTRKKIAQQLARHIFFR